MTDKNNEREKQLVEDVMEVLQLEPEGPARLSKAAGLSKTQRGAKFPTRLLRYAIPWAWLRRFANRLGRPLRIAEIGVGSGQMKSFVEEAERLATESGSPLRECELIETWSGFDIAPQEAALEKAGYRSVEQFDADSPGGTSFHDFDVVLLLHVLEHLQDPERFAEFLKGTMSPGSQLIAGVPSVPAFLEKIRERRLRAKYKQGGHWCKYSDRRAVEFMRLAGLEEQDIAGAFLLRWSGSFLENDPAWFQRNFSLARNAPWWPGEIYFAGIRKPNA